jgi:hypothetical protein
LPSILKLLLFESSGFVAAWVGTMFAFTDVPAIAGATENARQATANAMVDFIIVGGFLSEEG